MTESKESLSDFQNNKDPKFQNEEQEEEENYVQEEEEMMENEEQEEKPEKYTKNYLSYKEPNELPDSQNLPMLKPTSEQYETFNVPQTSYENFNAKNDSFYPQPMTAPKRAQGKASVNIQSTVKTSQNKNDIITQSMSQSSRNVSQKPDEEEQKYIIPVTAKFYKPGLAKLNEKPETILNQNKSNFIQRTLQLTSPKKLERLEKYEQQISPKPVDNEMKKQSDYEDFKNEDESPKRVEQSPQDIITQQPIQEPVEEPIQEPIQEPVEEPIQDQANQENPQNIPDIYIQNNENQNYEDYKYYEDRNVNLTDCYQFKADPHYKLDNCRIHYDFIGEEKQVIPGKVEYHFNLYRKPKEADYYSDQESDDPTEKKAYIERSMRNYRFQPVVRRKNKLVPSQVENEINYSRRLNPSLSQENFEHCTCMEVPCIKRFEHQDKPYQFGANLKAEKPDPNEQEKYYNDVILGNNNYEPMSFKNIIDGYPVSCRLNHGKHCRLKGGNKPCRYEVYSISPEPGQNVRPDNIDLTVPESVYREEYKQNLHIRKNPRKLRPELVEVLKEKCAPKQPINVVTYTKKYSETVEPRFDVNKLGRSVYGNVKYHPYYGGYHTNVQKYHRSANSVMSSYCMKYLEKKLNNGNNQVPFYDSDKEIDVKYKQSNFAAKHSMPNPENNRNNRSYNMAIPEDNRNYNMASPQNHRNNRSYNMAIPEDNRNYAMANPENDRNYYESEKYIDNYNPEYVYDVRYVDCPCQCENCMY